MIHGDRPPVENLCRDAAAAELLAISLEETALDIGVDGNIVSMTTKGQGIHLYNHHKDFDFDVHLVMNPKEVGSGPLKGNITYNAEQYVNMKVYGLQREEDRNNYALPTHAPTKAEAVQKPLDDIDDRIQQLAETQPLLTLDEKS